MSAGWEPNGNRTRIENRDGYIVAVVALPIHADDLAALRTVLERAYGEGLRFVHGRPEEDRR